MTPQAAFVVVVIGDDSVAAGMVALDLVQAGVRATAASDDYAVIETVDARREAGAMDQTAVVAAFDDIGKITGLWKQLVDRGMLVRFVAAVRPRDRALAEHEAVRGGWVGVADRPITVESLLELLRRPPPSPRQGGRESGEFGDLYQRGLGDLLDSVLVEASRGGRIDAVIRLESDGRGGEVAVVDGHLVHAVADADHGRHALERMFCWRRGTWRLVWGRHVGAKTLAGNWRGTLAAAHEYARRVEEARLSLPLRDRVCQVRWERARPLPAVAEAVFRRVAAGMPIGVAIDGEGDDELEALAALHSRIARGAVLPRESDPPQSGSWQGGVASAEPGRRSDAVLPPDARRSGALAAQPRAASAASAALSGAWSHTPRSPRGQTMGVPRTTLDGSATNAALVDSPVQPRPAHRHAETVTYRSGIHGGLDGLPDAADSDDGAGLLPAALPEPLAFDDLPAAPPSASRAATGAWRGTSWFGVNVRQEATAGQARLEALGQSLVAPPPFESAPESADLPEPRRAEPVASVPAGRPARREESVALEAWTQDESEEELDRDEPEIAPIASTRRRTMLSLLLVLLGVTFGVLVLWPNSPLLRAGDDDGQSPIVQTHRRAVALIDAGRGEEALGLLQLIDGRSGVSPEALLEQAILEIELGQLEQGRRDLHRYLLHRDARHADAAGKLYARVSSDLQQP